MEGDRQGVQEGEGRRGQDRDRRLQHLRGEAQVRDVQELRSGPTGLKNWKDYCADLSDTKLRGELIDDSLALQSDGKDLGIDWVQESYGIIYNKELLEKAGYKAEDINSFDKLKACADDIQARKDELGVHFRRYG